MIDSDGNQVTGAFVDEKIHGPGELKTKEGLTVSGDFVEGELSGKCVVQMTFNELQYKFNGVVSEKGWDGKFEIKKGSDVVSQE